MNEAMKQAWLEITQMMGEPTQDELHVFLRTWQKAIQAEREECAKVCEELLDRPSGYQGTWEGYVPEPTQKRPPNCGTGHCSCIECVMEPAQQEPIAWMYLEPENKFGLVHVDEYDYKQFPEEDEWIPVYKSPPAQRTWVGLTDKEFEGIIMSAPNATVPVVLWQLIQDKLKEKNT